MVCQIKRLKMHTEEKGHSKKQTCVFKGEDFFIYYEQKVHSVELDLEAAGNHEMISLLIPK